MAQQCRSCLKEPELSRLLACGVKTESAALRLELSHSSVRRHLENRHFQYSSPRTAGIIPIIDLTREIGFEPDDYQEKVLTSDADKEVLCWSRQSGKTEILALLSLHELLRQDATVIILSPSLRQSQEMIRRVTGLLSNWHDAPEWEAGAAFVRIPELNSRCLALPGSDGATVRGMVPTFIGVDEAAFVSEALIHAIRPMRAVSGARMVMISTPNGRSGWFSDLWHNDVSWAKSKVTAYECPRITAEFLESEKASLAPEIFSQEYLVEFVQGGRFVFSEDDLNGIVDEAEEVVLWNLFRSLSELATI